MIFKEKLEHLLVKNWATILDSKQLLRRVLEDVSRGADTFMVVNSHPEKERNISISISRFQLAEDGFIIWVEFTVPREKATDIGTAEYRLLGTESLVLQQLLGTRFIKTKAIPA